MATKEGISQDLIAPWLGTAKQKEEYSEKKKTLSKKIKDYTHMIEGVDYLMKDPKINSTGVIGEDVYLEFLKKKGGKSPEDLKMNFIVSVHGKLVCKDPKNLKYKDVAVFVKLDDYSLNDDVIITPSRAGGFEDEILKLQKTRTEELTEIFYLLHLPIVPNKDQYNLEENWLSCNQKDDGDVEKNVKILTSIGLLAARRIDNAIPGNISVGLNDDIPSVLQILKTKRSIFPEILLGDDACENAKWIIEKFFRDVKFETSPVDRKIGLTSKWAAEKNVDEIVKALFHYGVMAISCDSRKSTNFVILRTKRAVYEFSKSEKGISYTELVNKLMALELAGKLDELPEDFTSVVTFDFKKTSAGAIQVRNSRKMNKTHAEVYELIKNNLGIPAYNQNSPLVKSMKISNGEAPNKEGKDYYKILILRDEDDSSTKQDIIDTLDPVGYDCHYVGEKEGKKLSKKTICFYPKKKEGIVLQNPEPAVVLEKSAGETEVKQVEEPKLVLSTVDVLIPIVESILSHLDPEGIKMLVSKITSLKPAIPEPKVVDKTTDNIDKLLQFYKLVPAEKSDAYNASYFATKEQVLELLLSEDSTA